MAGETPTETAEAEAPEPGIRPRQRRGAADAVEGEAERNVLARGLPRQQRVVLEQHAYFGRCEARIDDAGKWLLQSDDGA